MQKRIKTMAELRDSRLLFDREPPAFGYMLLLVIAVAFLGAIIWSRNAIKPYMIVSQGTVTSRDASYVMPAYAGEMESCQYKEGDLVRKGDVLFAIKSTDLNLQKQQLQANAETYKKQIEKGNLLVKSLQDDQNYFDMEDPDDQLYYSTFENYKSQVAQNKFDASMYQAYGYSEEQIASEMEKNQKKISELYYTAIQSAENTIHEAEVQLESLQSQLDAVNNGKDEYQVKAPVDGVLHWMAGYKDGMVVQAGTAVASVAPQNGDSLIEAYVTTADMARMKEGNKVQMAVDGLMQTVYGNIEGTVESIDSNVTTLEGADGDSKAVFKIRIQPSMNYVVSKTGKKVNLSNGMSVEARIRYEEVTYFDYVIDKLGIKG